MHVHCKPLYVDRLYCEPAGNCGLVALVEFFFLFSCVKFLLPMLSNSSRLKLLNVDQLLTITRIASADSKCICQVGIGLLLVFVSPVIVHGPSLSLFAIIKRLQPFHGSKNKIKSLQFIIYRVGALHVYVKLNFVYTRINLIALKISLPF